MIHIDMIAPHSCCSCLLHIHDVTLLPPPLKGAPGDWELLDPKAIWVRWAQYHVQETSLTWSELYHVPFFDHQPEPLIFSWINPSCHVVYTKFCPYHSNIAADQPVSFPILICFILVSLFKLSCWPGGSWCSLVAHLPWGLCCAFKSFCMPWL